MPKISSEDLKELEEALSALGSFEEAEAIIRMIQHVPVIVNEDATEEEIEDYSKLLQADIKFFAEKGRIEEVNVLLKRRTDLLRRIEKWKAFRQS